MIGVDLWIWGCTNAQKRAVCVAMTFLNCQGGAGELDGDWRVGRTVGIGSTGKGFFLKLYLCMRVHIYKCQESPEEDVGSSGTVGTDSWGTV